jgi:hypothetical protein
MKSTFKKRYPRLVALAVFLASVTANSKASTPQITINVYNDAALEESTLRKAQEEATSILKRAGIEAEWINCKGPTPEQAPNACLLPMSQTHLAVSIVPFQMDGADSSLGVAFLAENQPGVYADVFYPSIERLVRDYGTSRSLVLGNVMAHEIGHLLLGIRSHSPIGIMRPHWCYQELDQVGKGTLQFTPTQAHAMQARLMATTQPPEAGTSGM